MMLKRKSGAIELSMTTIIVVVLSLTLLILGFVFVRSIMCGAIGFTEEINSKVNREIQNLFETSGGIPQTEAVKWVTRKSWEESDFPPNDKTARKTITVSIPEDASEGNIR